LVKPLTSLIESRGQFDPKNIARRILKEFEFVTEPQDNAALVAHLIAIRDGVRYAVVVVADRSGDASPKAIANLKNSLDQLNCTKVLGIVFDQSVPSALQSLCSETGGIAVERDDLEQFAKLVDNKYKFEKAKYESRFNGFSLSRSAQAKKKDSIEVDEDDYSDDFEDNFMEKSLRARQGTPESKPRRFRS
jgi:hypothetical protein